MYDVKITKEAWGKIAEMKEAAAKHHWNKNRIKAREWLAEAQSIRTKHNV